MAIHHGRLPNPFLREVELLLSAGVLKVTVASPTLAQGLNLNAAVLLVPSFYRAAKIISGEEFANVAGRAGRAFVDVEGLVLHVMHKGEGWRLAKWRGLVASAKARALRSGLIQIVAEILKRLSESGTLDRDDAFEYLANSRQAWMTDEGEVNVEDADEEENSEEPLSHLVEKLDAAVFGLLEALDADSDDLPRLLDEALHGSLWERQILREPTTIQELHKGIFRARAQLIWNNSTATARKGHFAMGVGLEAGLALDAIADETATLIDKADEASISGDAEVLADSLIDLARLLLVIRPFTPDPQNALPENWEDILRAWVRGDEVNDIGPDNMRIVEDAFSYRLVWALEALRVRRVMMGWSPDIIAGGGAAALETGVPQLMMSMLIRAGLPSRRAAIAAVTQGNPMFLDGRGMREWIESEEVAGLTVSGTWPTIQTAPLWKRFCDDLMVGPVMKWNSDLDRYQLDLSGDLRQPSAGIYRVEIDKRGGDVWLSTPDYRRVAKLKSKITNIDPSVFWARISEGDGSAEIERVGRGRATWSRTDVDGVVE